MQEGFYNIWKLFIHEILETWLLSVIVLVMKMYSVVDLIIPKPLVYDWVLRIESPSKFNEAWFTNWERMSIVPSYSLSMRLQLFLLKLLVAKWQWLLILLVPIEYRFHWLPFYQLSTFDYLVLPFGKSIKMALI